jgi:bifunctional N-acetylglucosamine-1-phosphate-uridyltransferase/glucosamine-1-phosphate-acetyltransferase GlmU-like protein
VVVTATPDEVAGINSRAELAEAERAGSSAAAARRWTMA